MADLKKLTVRALRELARKHMGPGFSRLKTRTELISALAKILPRSIREALEPKAANRTPPTASPNPRANGARQVASVAPPPPEPRKKAAHKPQPVEAPVAPAKRVESEPPTPLPAQPSSPPAPASFDERLGELPESYGEDAVILLPKDPHSLYLYWDFSPTTLDRAFAWMPGLHTRLRLFDGDRLLREVDFSVGARSWYFHGLAPARTYRVEMVALAQDGQARRIGPASNPMRLPALGPSRYQDDRFVRVPFDLPAGQLAEIMRQSLRALVQGAGPVAPPAGERSLAPRHARPVSGPGFPFVEPPAFAEEGRERIYEASGGTARGLGSSENQPLPPTGTPADPRPAPLFPWSEGDGNQKA
jgi:DNA-directed RNA polymerase subunit K/omega